MLPRKAATLSFKHGTGKFETQVRDVYNIYIELSKPGFFRILYTPKTLL